MFDKLDKTITPDMEMISAYVRSSVWDQLINHIETTYNVSPKLEYSRCSVPGWNVKYRKKGKSLSTLYPMENYFICLIVINDKQKDLFESQINSFSQYTQDLYHTTQSGMGQKWLMMEVEDEYMLEDIKRCFTIRLAAV